MSLRYVLAILVAACVVVPTTTTAPTPSTPVTTVAVAPLTTVTTTTTVQVIDEFVALINKERIRVGLPTLASNSDLVDYATRWAETMVASGFRHSDIATLLGSWTVVGENIGRGPTAGMIFDALLVSSTHYTNIVDPRFTHLGVGSVVDAGKIWTVHVFAAKLIP